jgi:hypothetical protein
MTAADETTIAMLDEGDAALTSAGEFLRAHLAGPRR